MRWTAARSRTLALLAPSVAGHVGLHLTRYEHGCIHPGRGWITWDGEQIASFDTQSYWQAQRQAQGQLMAEGLEFSLAYDQARILVEAEGPRGNWHFSRAVEAYPELTVEQALVSSDPITRGLAMFDRRLGKRRLRVLPLAHDELPFVRRLYQLRCAAEGLSLPLT